MECQESSFIISARVWTKKEMRINLIVIGETGDDFCTKVKLWLYVFPPGS